MKAHGFRAALAGLGFAGIVAASSAAAAPARDAAAAETLFERGRAAVAAQDWEHACAAFEQSEALDPAAGTLLNLGECRVHLGKVASAWQDFVEALRELPADDERRSYAEGKIADVAKRVPRLTVLLRDHSPPGTTVTRNGVEMPAATLGDALPVDPGRVSLVVQAPDHAPASFSVDLEEAETTRIEVAPGPLLPAREAAPAVRARSGAQGTWRTIGFVGIATGAAALATGAVTGILALSRASDYAAACGPSHACPDGGALDRAHSASADAKTLGGISTATLAAGGVLAAAGLAVVITHPSSRESGGSALEIAPAPGGAAAVWCGSF
jgi:hypothetical protein